MLERIEAICLSFPLVVAVDISSQGQRAHQMPTLAQEALNGNGASMESTTIPFMLLHFLSPCIPNEPDELQFLCIMHYALDSSSGCCKARLANRTPGVYSKLFVAFLMFTVLSLYPVSVSLSLPFSAFLYPLLAKYRRR